MTASRPLVFAVLFAAGCANVAVRPASPAAALSPAEAQAAAAALYPPGDKFFLAIFGSQRRLPTPDRCHTWAAAVRVSAGGVAEVAEVSWMPATLDIHPERLRVEPGVNLTQAGALAYAASDGQYVVGWGPYEITPGLFHRLRLQQGWLEAGGVQYQSIDTLGEAGRTGRGTNCIHALGDVGPEFGPGRQPLTTYGVAAGRVLVRRLHADGGLAGDGRAVPAWRAAFEAGPAPVRWRD